MTSSGYIEPIQEFGGENSNNGLELSGPINDDVGCVDSSGLGNRATMESFRTLDRFQGEHHRFPEVFG